MAQALSPIPFFLANILSNGYQGQTVIAKEEALAKAWACYKNLKKITPVNWWTSLQHLYSETVEVIISFKSSNFLYWCRRNIFFLSSINLYFAFIIKNVVDGIQQ